MASNENLPFIKNMSFKENFTFSENVSFKQYVNEDWALILQAILIAPECLNCIFLLMGIYGMYQGIEIQHPLYAMMFLNLIVALFFTILDLIAFFFISTDRFVSISNASSGFTLFFHCTCWCVTSIIRYVYIVHEAWIHNVMPSHRRQSYLAFGFSFILFLTLSFPPIGYAMYLGIKLS